MNDFRTMLEIAGAACAVIAFIIKINRDRDAVLKTIEQNVATAKELADNKLQAAREEGDVKRARIYERLDELKKAHQTAIDRVRSEFKDTYVDIRLCKIVHENTDRIFSEIRTELLDLKKSIDRLFDKLSEVSVNGNLHK